MSPGSSPAAHRASTEHPRARASWVGRHPNFIPLLILLVLAALTRLGGLGHPRSVVFDEVYFGEFASHYCCDHKRFFDIHPPLGKLVIAGTAHLLGYDGDLTFAAIGQPFDDVSPVPLRLAPALAGMALPLIFFAILRLLGASPPAALFGGLLLVFDNALTTHTRMIGVDGIMLAGMFGALACWLAANRGRTPWSRYGLALACGALLGLAAGSKLIGLAMGALIGLCLLVELLRQRNLANTLLRFGQGGVIALGALGVYLLGWALHFALLKYPGSGDAWMRPSGLFFADLIRAHQAMIEANSTVAGHPYGSPWWSWPLMTRPIFYWVGDAGAKIYLLGNPLVWWGGSLLFVVVLAIEVLRRITHLRIERPSAHPAPNLWLPLAGFVLCYAPFIAIDRVMFLYHYFAALLFSLMLGVLWLDGAGWIRPGGLRAQRLSYHFSIGLLALAFVLLAPLTYGLQFGASVADQVFRLFPR